MSSANAGSTAEAESIYAYSPSQSLPIVFAVLIGLSLSIHLYQNYRYRFWRVTFFLTWAGLVFTSGWVMRAISSFNPTYTPTNLDFYISQYVLVLAGPPIYAAAEYNILGRVLCYVPQVAPLHPGRVIYVFIYLGAIVEGLTAAGASQIATLPRDQKDKIRQAETIVSAALLLQAIVEVLFMTLVGTVHARCAKTGLLPKNLRWLFIMLYGTSSLVLIRCIFRAIESFALVPETSGEACKGICSVVLTQEWYLYVFEAAPMLIYTFWLNLVHPGRLLPRDKTRYLDSDGQEERHGPGWLDRRSRLETFIDPFDFGGLITGKRAAEAFWERPGEWRIADGSFALGTGSNVRREERSMAKV